MSTHSPQVKKSRPLWTQSYGIPAVIDEWQRGKVWHQVSLHHRVAGRAADYVPIPKCLNAGVLNALEARGIHRLYSHK